MKNLLCTLVVTLILVGGCSSQDSSFMTNYNFSGVDKVAIVAIEGAVTSEAAKDQIADFYMMELLKKGYAPVERAQVKALLQEQAFETEGLTASERAVESGLILDVPAVFTVSIPHFGENVTMTAKLISVKDGSILWMGSGSGKGGKGFMSIFDFGGAGEESGLGSESDALLAITGGFEDIPGKPLSPYEARKTNSIVRKICKTLPPKQDNKW